MTTNNKRSNMLAVIALTVLIILSLIILMTYSKSQQLNWQSYSPQLIASAQSNQQPVLIKFTANWCTGCKMLEVSAYQNPIFIDALKQTNILPVTADLSEFNQSSRALLKQYGGEILPYIVLLDKNGKIQHQLQGIFTQKQLTHIIAPNNINTSKEQ